MRETASVQKRLLTTREVAKLLSVSVFTVRGFAVRRPAVVRFTPTSRMRFRVEDVERLVTNAFAKLGVRNRRELAAQLGSHASEQVGHN